MTGSSDPVEVAQSSSSERVKRDVLFQLGAGVVQAVCRLIHISTVEPEGPAALEKQAEDTAAILREYGRRSGQGVSILFSQGVVFVGGKLLRGSRALYEEAVAVGQVLDRCGISEIAAAKDIFAADLKTLSHLLSEFYKCPEPVVPERITPRLRLRPVSDAARRHEVAGEQGHGTDEAIVHTYATAIVLMRRFFEGLRGGSYALPRRFRRIAQRLVDLSAGETPAFLGVTAARNANHDDAGRAVNTAVLSLAMARQITSDAVLLERLAMAALLYDTAKPRLVSAGRAGSLSSVVPSLSDAQEADVPAGTAVVLTALGTVTDASMMRTVMAYEAHWVKRHAQLGPLYRGLRQPTLQARIIAMARAFNDLLTPAPGREPLAADDAIATLEKGAAESADRTVLRLLVGALGIFPTGTLVELSTGEVALIVQTPEHPALYSRPRVRLVIDASGGTMDDAMEIDLAQPPGAGEPARHIRKVVATSDDAAATTLRSLAASSAGRSMSGRNSGRLTGGGLSMKAPASLAREPEDENKSSSRASGPMSAVTPPTIPGSSAVASRRVPGMGDTPAPGGRTMGNQSGFRPPTPAPPARPALLLIDDEPTEQEQVTRQQMWHDQAYLLSIEQAVAQKDAEQESGMPERLSELPGPAIPTAPTAEGVLVRTPLVHLLVYMLDRRLTGTTIFQTPDGTSHSVFFSDGVPAKVRTGTPIATLDRVLLEVGLLDEAVIKEALVESMRARQLFGRYIVARGLLDRDTMLSVLGLQLVRKMIGLFEMPPETRYAYYDGTNLLTAYAGPELFPCEALAVVMAGIRLRAHDPLVNATLERIGSRAFALHPDGDVARFRFVREEAAVAELLRTRRMTLADLLSAGVAREKAVRLTVYALAITRHLDVGVTGRPPVGVAASDGGDVDPVSLRGGPISLRQSAPASTRDPSRSGRAGSTSGRFDAVTPRPPSVPLRSRDPLASPIPAAPVTPASPAGSTGSSPAGQAEEPLGKGGASEASAVRKSVPPPAPPAPSAQGPSGKPQEPAVSTAPAQTTPANVPTKPTPPGASRPASGARPVVAPKPMPTTSTPAAAGGQGAAARPGSGAPAPAPARPATSAGVASGSPATPAARPGAAPAASTPAASTPATSAPRPAAASPSPGTPARSPALPPASPLPRPKTGFGLTFGQPASSKRPPSPPAAHAPPPPAAESPAPRPVVEAPPANAPQGHLDQAPPAAPSPAPPAVAHQEPLELHFESPAPSPAHPSEPDEVTDAGQGRITMAYPLPPPDSPRRTEAAARFAEIERRSETIDTEDYFTILGVSHDVSPDDLKAAYFGLAKIWHPDRQPADLEDAKPIVARIFSRISEAYRTLNDAQRRREYIASRSAAMRARGGKGGPEGGNEPPDGGGIPGKSFKR